MEGRETDERRFIFHLTQEVLSQQPIRASPPSFQHLEVTHRPRLLLFAVRGPARPRPRPPLPPPPLPRCCWAPTMSLIKAGRCVYQRCTALAKLE